MQKSAEPEKGDMKNKGEACALEESQRKQAVNLHTAQINTARSLERHNKKDAADLLGNDQAIKETAEEARRCAAATLAETQDKAAAALEDSQAKAATALKVSQTEAASALQNVLHKKE